jgi:ubiquitin C-terminal hydrolase
MPASRQTPTRPYSGLYNLGNTCWANSVLQALVSTARLHKLLTTLPSPASSPLLNAIAAESSPEIDYEASLTLALRSVLISLWQRPDKPVKASHLLDRWTRQSDGCIVGEQQDAHEGLMALLNGVSMEDLDVGGLLFSKDPSIPPDRLATFSTQFGLILGLRVFSS